MKRSKQHKIIDSRYKVINELGSGGMGIVYKVKDLINNKIIALKILTEQVSRSVSVQRFKKEFYFLTQLNHPNLTRVFDFGSDDDKYYFKKPHAISYALNIVLQLHLIKGSII